MKKTNKLVFPVVMILPATLLMLFVSVYPVIQGIYMGLTDASLMNQGRMKFIGIDNFVKIIHDSEFISALKFTFVFVIFSVLLTYIAGMSVALIMNRLRFGRNIFRAMLLIPWVIPAVVGANSWMWILNDQTGIVNNVLQSLGIIKQPILFLLMWVWTMRF